MTRQRIIFILGLWTAALPFLGFPSGWKKALFVATGFAVAYLAYLLYREKKKEAAGSQNRANTYTDNRQESAGQ